MKISGSDPNIYQEAGKLSSASSPSKMAALQKIKEIQRLISTFDDDKLAVSLVISDKFQGYRICEHSSLSDVVESRLSPASSASSLPPWKMDGNKYTKKVIYPCLAKPFKKLTRDDMRQLLGAIIRLEQNRLGHM